jgi:hypothetical protein
MKDETPTFVIWPQDLTLIKEFAVISIREHAIIQFSHEAA